MLLEPPFGVEEGHVYGLRVGPVLLFFLIQCRDPVPSAKDTSAPGQSSAMAR